MTVAMSAGTGLSDILMEDDRHRPVSNIRILTVPSIPVPRMSAKITGGARFRLLMVASGQIVLAKSSVLNGVKVADKRSLTAQQSP